MSQTDSPLIDEEFLKRYRRQCTLGRIGYFFLAVAVSVGLFFAYRNDANLKEERQSRENQVNTFLIRQCVRDGTRDSVVIDALKDAQRRASESLASDPRGAEFEIQQLQISIDRLRELKPQCVKSIPLVRDGG